MTKLPLTIEHALLGFLHREPLHGYELYQQLTDPAGLWLVWRIKLSQLYALLTKLEKTGYISATLQPQENRPPRKVFALTERGDAAYHAWVQSPVLHGRMMRQEFLAKLFFALREGQAVARQLITRQRAESRQWLAEYAPRSHDFSDQPNFATLVNQFRSHQIEAVLAWLDQCEEMIAATSAPT